MKVVSLTELRKETLAILRCVSSGQLVVVMRHGKPCAAVIRISEDMLDQRLFENSPVVKQAIQEALEDLKRGRSTTLTEQRHFTEGEWRKIDQLAAVPATLFAENAATSLQALKQHFRLRRKRIK